MPKTAIQMVMEARAKLDNISPQAAAAELEAGGVVVLDVREPVEWEQYIPGAIQVPRGVLESSADPTSPRHRAELDPASRVIVYCRSGARSALAGVTLQELGFQNVANLDGGFTAWKEAGMPIADHHEGM